MPPLVVRDAASYSFAAGERVLIDSNVWLDIYAPAWLHKSQKRLSISSYELLERCQISGCLLYFDPLVYSEVVHRIVRIGYERTESRLSYKDWRASRESGSVVRKAHKALQNMIDVAPHTTDRLLAADYQQISDELVRTHADFNDLVLARLCAAHELTMVSNDRDMLDLEFLLLVTGLN